MAGLKTLLAITTIHLTVAPGKAGDRSKGIAPVPPKVKEIAKGTRFKAMSPEQEKELIDMKAARPLDKDVDGDDSAPVVETKVTDADLAAQQAGADAADLDRARAEYQEVFGEAPHARLKAETIRDRIAEKKAADEKAAKADDGAGKTGDGSELV